MPAPISDDTTAVVDAEADVNDTSSALSCSSLVISFLRITLKPMCRRTEAESMESPAVLLVDASAACDVDLMSARFKSRQRAGNG